MAILDQFGMDEHHDCEQDAQSRSVHPGIGPPDSELPANHYYSAIASEGALPALRRYTDVVSTYSC